MVGFSCFHWMGTWKFDQLTKSAIAMVIRRRSAQLQPLFNQLAELVEHPKVLGTPHVDTFA